MLQCKRSKILLQFQQVAQGTLEKRLLQEDILLSNPLIIILLTHISSLN